MIAFSTAMKELMSSRSGRNDLYSFVLARNQTAFAILYICERAKAVVLDFEDPVGMVERLRSLRQARRSFGSVLLT